MPANLNAELVYLLGDAVENYSAQVVSWLLKRHPYSKNDLTDLLHTAVNNNEFHSAKALLDYGADPQGMDLFDVLDYDDDNASLTKLLIQYGASTDGLTSADFKRLNLTNVELKAHAKKMLASEARNLVEAALQ